MKKKSEKKTQSWVHVSLTANPDPSCHKVHRYSFFLFVLALNISMRVKASIASQSSEKHLYTKTYPERARI